MELPECEDVYDNKRSYVLPDGVSNGAEVYDYEDVVVTPVLGVHKTGMMGRPPLLNEGSLGDVIKAGIRVYLLGLKTVGKNPYPVHFHIF
jgi:hypothetical protein